MTTKILDADGINKAAELIKAGELVAFPTETVYGLGADALNEDAVKKIFEAKGRPQDNPLIVHTQDIMSLARLALELPPLAAVLAEAFLPGPLTLILPKTGEIPAEVTAGLATVGLRVPSDPVAREFLCHAQVPVAAPSANLSGKPSPTTFEMACEAMEGRVDAIIRGEPSQVGLESTIVRVCGDGIEILRPGGITEEAIREVARNCPVRSVTHEEEGPPPAPGMKYTHYKPRANLILYHSKEERDEMLRRWQGKKTGILSLAETRGNAAANLHSQGNILLRELSGAEDYARRLYAEFFAFDCMGCELILAEYPPETGIGRAVANRLRKAAGNQEFFINERHE